MDRIVCAWYTPDYSHWAEKLAASCDRAGEKHDLIGVAKTHAGWEAETQRKPFMVRDAVRKYAACSLVVFVDADCTIEKSLDGLQQSFHADIGVYCRSVMRTRRQVFFRSGTIALSPNERTYQFLDHWCAAAGDSHHGTVDQDSFAVAVETATLTRIQFLPIAYCTTRKDIAQNLAASSDAVILHDHASLESADKESWFSKRWRRMAG